MSLFQMGMAGGVLTLFIVVVRALAIHRLPKTTFFVLWMIAAVRLLLPFSISLPFNIPIGLNVFSDVVQNAPTENIVFALPGESLPSYDTGTAAPSPAAEQVSTVGILWLLGVLLLVLYFSISYFRSIRKFKMSIPDNTPYIKAWLRTHQIVRPIEVRCSDLISSPLTYGILHPVILLPKKLDRHDQSALKCVLTHEYVHIRRFDAVTKILFAAVLCIHWMNPLVWILYVLANRDMELSCDACVIRMMGGENRSAYALALIRVEETRNSVSALCSQFGKNAITERIEAIMKFKKTSTLACGLAFAVVIGATTAFASSGNTAAKPEQNDRLTHAVMGIAYDGSELLGIDLSGAGNNAGNKVQLVEGGKSTADSAPISLDSIKRMDSADLPVELGELKLISVSHHDESKFTQEEWAKILQQIEQGTVYWED